MVSSSAAPAAGLRPVQDGERIALVDVLRGLALYGVLVANTLPWYSGRLFLPEATAAAQTRPSDVVVLALVKVFIDSKAMTLFSFLFGLGFAIQLERSTAAGRNAGTLYARRLGILLLIGMCHVTLISYNDILTSYAVTGFLLLAFRRASNRALLLSATISLFLPMGLLLLSNVSPFLARFMPSGPPSNEYRAQMLASLGGHDYLAVIRAHWRQFFYFLSIIALRSFPWILGRFLLGYVVGRSGVLLELARHRSALRKILGWGLGLGLAVALTEAVGPRFIHAGLPVPAKFALTVAGELSVLGVAAAYLSAVALLLERPRARRILLAFSPVGQAALSGYLLQSLLSSLVFYGWGFGLIGRVRPALCIPITLAIFALVMLACHLWLRAFRFGPVEWLWRSLTYGRLQSMRRTDASPQPAA